MPLRSDWRVVATMIVGVPVLALAIRQLARSQHDRNSNKAAISQRHASSTAAAAAHRSRSPIVGDRRENKAAKTGDEAQEQLDSILNFSTACARAPIGDRAKMLSTIEIELQKQIPGVKISIWISEPNTRTLIQHSTRQVVADDDPTSLIAESFRNGAIINQASPPLKLVPMIALGTVLAVVQATIDTTRFNDEQSTPMIETMAAVAALFLQNSGMYNALSDTKEVTDAMLRMARMLSQDTLEESRLVASIIRSARELCDADRCAVFTVHDDLLRAHFEGQPKPVVMPISAGIAGHVARTGETVNIKDAYTDPRFNADIDRATGYRTRSILCMPVSFEGKIVAVAQLVNKNPMEAFQLSADAPQQRVHFTAVDEARFASLSAFIGVCLRNCRANHTLRKEKERRDAILDVAGKLTTTDIRRIDDAAEFILQGAKRLLRAERASLFVVDKEHGLLRSKAQHNTDNVDLNVSLHTGIVGQVARTGVAVNVADAQSELPRLVSGDNSGSGSGSSDANSGIRSLITLPILADGDRGGVVAVAQLINKLPEEEAPLPKGRHPRFTDEDQTLFNQFALFAGMALSNAHLLQFAVKAGEEAMHLSRTSPNSSAKNSNGGAGRMDASFNILAMEDEFATVMAVDLPADLKESVGTTSFDLFDLRRRYEANAPDVAARLIAHLIWTSGLPLKFGCDYDTLVRFILACRRKYRQVPYHNFFHAVDVCQTMYCFLYHGKASDFVDSLECFVLLITALVHDLDHMGLNNSYHMKTSSPLGILSSATGNNSVLEVHHCNLAIEILDMPENNVFGKLDVNVRQNAMRRMIQCVLATDMARHGEFCKTYDALAAAAADEPPRFVFENADHRLAIMQHLTKAADISNVTKKFPTSKQWGQAVTEEFYHQGDLEREAGVDVLPMNDRRLGTELAKGQLGFINFVAEGFFRNTCEKGVLKGLNYALAQLLLNKQSWNDELTATAKAAEKVV